MKISKSKGFTLIELMVVIGIISILASISIPIYSNYKLRARTISNIYANTGQLRTAIADDLNSGLGISEQDYTLSQGYSVINVNTSGATIQLSLGELYPDSEFDSTDLIRLVGQIQGTIITWQCTYNEDANHLENGDLPNTCISESY
ncbi:prepilin-type N-terminal cleavage/methylation domain-containing protein [Francisella uliginis]|uniref:PilE-like C-terminal domain-containing protein n=1 Tax=Francisella uliginis TaxID=573570 RepID=A0A1L4BQX7_9GAMM|nr:prepilin-type N-terminal cleavage/methylation domain-containing protein [Francisella uliginis]API86239.1 hypothetical protein F7310_02220 [Francisella uliginis]